MQTGEPVQPQQLLPSRQQPKESVISEGSYTNGGKVIKVKNIPELEEYRRTTAKLTQEKFDKVVKHHYSIIEALKRTNSYWKGKEIEVTGTYLLRLNPIKEVKENALQFMHSVYISKREVRRQHAAKKDKGKYRR
jgi:hypothetical protein